MFLSRKGFTRLLGSCLKKKSSLVNPRVELFTTSSLALSDDQSHDVPISRFPVPSLDDLPNDLKDKFGKSKFMPNVFSALSYRPDELRAFVNYHEVLMQNNSNLTREDKEMISVVVSAENQCLYCVAAHSALYRIYSRNPVLADQLATNWRMADLDKRQKAILDFAVDIANCCPQSDEKFQRLYEYGMTHDDAWDIGSLAAFLSMSNRLAHFLHVRPNPEFYFIGRIPTGTGKDEKS